MDAVEFAKERNRMCKAFRTTCRYCPLGESLSVGTSCIQLLYNRPEEMVGIIERWSKQNPVKTRQGEFLKQWPDARVRADGVLGICPNELVPRHRGEDGSCMTINKYCPDCRREFWMKEVE